MSPATFFQRPDGIDQLPIILRAYVPQPKSKAFQTIREDDGPSEWTLIFDTETTTDHAQGLKFGCYQVRKHETLAEAGIFYEADRLSPAEIVHIQAFAGKQGLACLTAAEFVDDVFYRVGFDWRGSIVGFNLPFDLSRLAIRYGSARGKMRGGFTFQLSQDKWKPRVLIKHLSSRLALMQFAGMKKRLDNRGDRRKGKEPRVRRGSFIDVRTISAALLSRSFSLAALADFLQTATRKAQTDEHGQELTADYLQYAMQDVQATWECYAALQQKFAQHGLSKTRLGQIMSEASLGKAYIKEMGIRPWQSLQPEFPASMIGVIMSTYFGGRTEVHMRRMIARVLYCDFLSMYPTVCTLMGLWRFVIASGITSRDTTQETRDWLTSATPADLQKPKNWARLTTLVQVLPDKDIFPVRSKYQQERAATIGSNFCSADRGLWFTLADCLASKFLSGKAPTVYRRSPSKLANHKRS